MIGFVFGKIYDSSSRLLTYQVLPCTVFVVSQEVNVRAWQSLVVIMMQTVLVSECRLQYLRIEDTASFSISCIVMQLEVFHLGEIWTPSICLTKLSFQNAHV